MLQVLHEQEVEGALLNVDNKAGLPRIALSQQCSSMSEMENDANICVAKN